MKLGGIFFSKLKRQQNPERSKRNEGFIYDRSKCLTSFCMRQFTQEIIEGRGKLFLIGHTIYMWVCQ